jgi:hypothetical protein
MSSSLCNFKDFYRNHSQQKYVKNVLYTVQVQVLDPNLREKLVRQDTHVPADEYRILFIRYRY